MLTRRALLWLIGAAVCVPTPAYSTVYRGVKVKTSREGIALIHEFESCRLKAYRDSKGVPTIGWGHTSMAGPPAVKMGLVITQEQADDIFVKDLVKFEQAVEALLKRNPTATQFDAMVSLCFNIGPVAFAGSSVLKHFNEGRFQQSADAFRAWRNITVRRRDKKTKKLVRVKIPLKGLIRRRAAERKHFLSTVA